MRRRTRGELLGSAAALAALCLAPAPSRAQDAAEGQAETAREAGEDGDEVILVTAERREESIQRLPLAISAFSEETLTDAGVSDINSLSRLVPSLQLQASNGSYTIPSLRGISAESSAPTSEPPVAISVDGVPYASPLLGATGFFDVSRIEVLRGPQGTISGRNATAGAINVYSNAPTDTVEGSVRVTLANYERVAVEAVLSGPLAGDWLLGRLAARVDRADGWVRNAFLNTELGTRDLKQFRLSLAVRPAAAFQADLIVDHIDDESNLALVDDGVRVRPDVPTIYELFDVPAYDREERVVFQDIPSLARYEKTQVTGRLTWDIAPSARLVSTTGFVDLETFITNDTDASQLVGTAWGPADPFGREPMFALEQRSQELTLTADVTDRLDLILGGLYIDLDQRNVQALGLPLNGIPPGSVLFDQLTELRSWGLYTQWRYSLTDRLRLTAGLRYTHDEKEYTEDSLIFGAPLVRDAESSWSAWTPRVSLDFAPAENLLLYATVSRGYKSGGFTGTLTGPILTYKPEYLWNYEVGLKGNWFDRRLTVDLAAFYTDYTNLQQTIALPGGTGGLVVNANSATLQGVEIQFNALITPRLRISGSGAWLDTKYDELQTLDAVFPELGVRDLSGNRLLRAPEWSYNIAAEYRLPLGNELNLAFRAAYSWTDRIFFNFYNRLSTSQPSYGLLDLSAELMPDNERWQVTAFVRNATDRFYRMFDSESSSAPGEFHHLVMPGPPRTYGVSIEYRF